MAERSEKLHKSTLKYTLMVRGIFLQQRNYNKENGDYLWIGINHARHKK